VKAITGKAVGRKLNYIDTCTGTPYDVLRMQNACVMNWSDLTGAESDPSF